MPYKVSIKVELVSKASAPVKGYNYIYHDSKYVVQLNTWRDNILSSRTIQFMLTRATPMT